MATHGRGRRDLDRGTRLVLKEIRDLRFGMRVDRRRADAERRRADAERRKADAAWREERRQVDAERHKADAAWQEERRKAAAAWQEERRQTDARLERERQQSDAKFQQLLSEFRADSARREAATQKAFRDIRPVGLSIVKTLNLHTRILLRIDGKLGAMNRWRPGSSNSPGL